MLDHASAFGDQRDPTVVLLPPAGATRHVWTPHARRLADGVRATAFQDTWPILETYDGPTLIVHGTDEAFASHARELAERVDADLVRIDGDHQTPIQHPDAFGDVLADFADDVAIAPLAPE